mgnify:CR=1 FL=1
MPLEFLKRGGKRDSRQAEPAPIPEEIEGEDYSLRLYYAAKSSDGVRMAARPGAVDDLPSMLVELANGPVEASAPHAVSSASLAYSLKKSLRAFVVP